MAAFQRCGFFHANRGTRKTVVRGVTEREVRGGYRFTGDRSVADRGSSTGNRERGANFSKGYARPRACRFLIPNAVSNFSRRCGEGRCSRCNGWSVSASMPRCFTSRASSGIGLRKFRCDGITWKAAKWDVDGTACVRGAGAVNLNSLRGRYDEAAEPATVR